MTLKGMPGDDATVEKTHWGYYRPWFRPWWGYGFYRPWLGYGFYRPWLYRPWYGYGFYRPWIYGPSYYGLGWPGYGAYYGYLPVSSGGYGTAESFDGGTPVTQLKLPSTPIPAAPEPETARAPVGPGQFRYDGGPTRPVPLPGTAPAPTVDESPANGPVVNRLVSQPKKKHSYPAYGETLPKPSARPNVSTVSSTRR